MANPSDSIILEEEIDPNYVPTDQEVADYAKWLGMDLEADKDLFWIAQEGLKVRVVPFVTRTIPDVRCQ
jgi:centrosomal protein CEP164